MERDNHQLMEKKDKDQKVMVRDNHLLMEKKAKEDQEEDNKMENNKLLQKVVLLK